MTRTATADTKYMSEGMMLEMRELMETFTENMLEEFDSMKWAWEGSGDRMMLGGNAVKASVFHALLLSSTAVMIKAGCPNIRIAAMMLEALALVPALSEEIRKS